MTIKQSRYITAETEAQKKVRVTEVQKIEEDPYIRRSEVQQTVNNSTLPVSSRAVKSAINSIEIPTLDGYATEEYVDNKVSSIDLSEYALTSDLSSAIESINSDLDLKADKTELEGLATEDYVNEKIDEKEIGITEPELISKSIGSGKWMREGAYGIGDNYTLPIPRDTDLNDLRSFGFYFVASNGVAGSIQNLPSLIRVKCSVEVYKNSNSYGDCVQRVTHFNSPLTAVRTYYAYGNKWTPWAYVLSTDNTYPDSNGVLHNSRNPIDTLNTSDMADTVVDNDLLTVTSGAVYRAIIELQNKIDLESLATREWVNERLSEFMSEVKEEIRKAQGVRFKDGGI